MKSVCFYFKIHQPFRLKRYRFFDIGNSHYYFDDFANDDIISRMAEQSYMPMIKTLLEMIEDSGRTFKCAISISGTAIEQLQLYVPECVELLKKLADTGCVEFLSGTYSHSLASIEDPEEFIREVKMHDDMVRTTFGVKPAVFANTELIYDDDIAAVIKSMGFKTCLTEGAKHILGWKSPNYVYSSASVPSLKLLLTNDKLAEDISMRFNNPAWDEYPLTADKYIDWIASIPEEEQIVNLYLSMDTFGTFIPANTGIFDFLKALPRFAREKGVEFVNPSTIVKKLKAVGELSIPFPVSHIDEARDVSAWVGNTLQKEALGKLYNVAERVNLCTDRRLKQDWEYLQSSDHFYYMSTKNLDDGRSHAAFSPYDSPFSAFTNYMNVLADFLVRVEEQYPSDIDDEELNSLLLTIRNQADEIESLNKEVKVLRNNILHADGAPEAPKEIEDKGAEAKKASKKSTGKRTSKKSTNK
ncbi:MAG: glycoside hydrolase family 57 protein [Clostridium sp.]|nr:glycoside hydrolase family 57 protein [Prevotella sp.]MCM1429447.1 glycoside hydrolase family 57 protein [Clostridium sp.]MCM1475518.1 glycoside hydrolase family 57 protein [Muribaculaceae bacterium]